MKTLPTNRRPLSAAAYLEKCQHRANRQACAVIAFREACFRLACYTVASIALCIAAGGLIQACILLSR